MSDIICISPVDGKEYARRTSATPSQIDAALARARAAQKSWAKVSLDERARYMMAFLEALRSVNEDVTQEIAMQMGRPIRYGGEFRSLEERVKALVDLAPEALAPLVPEPKAGFVRHATPMPVGLVFVIAPWNYPYLTAINTIVPALMSGNAVLLKHAAQTLLVGERLAQAFAQANLPEGLFQNLVLSHDDTARILSSGSVNHVTFTGSVEGGRAIERAAAGTFTSCTLELGGKDPAYVRADAKLDHAIENIVDGAFYNSGQCCCGIERIYVHESLYQPFIEGFAALTRQYKLGNPLDPETTLGPMANLRFAALVRSQTEDALARGAQALIDPKDFPANASGTPYLMPQVLVNVTHDMAVMQEENFGPLVGIMPVKDDSEAIRLMNDSQYGLTASIWTTDMDAAARIGLEIETGTVFANRCDYVDPLLTWTGVKNTGRGASVGRYGYASLTQPRSFHLRSL